MEATEKRYYSDHEFKKDVLKVKNDLVKKNYEVIIAPFRGGLTFGTKLSHVLNIPLGIVEYQRLDATSQDKKMRLAVEPVAIDVDGLEVPFISLKGKILLVDDICDSGETIAKVVQYLKLLNPNISIDVVCLFGSMSGIKYVLQRCIDTDIRCLNANEGKWVVFETWEDDYNRCAWCAFGEPCYVNPGYDSHCHKQNKSFASTHSCSDFTIQTFERPNIV